MHRTGAEIRQITAHPSIHHHPFYYIPAYDDAMRHLVFVSHRTGRPELFLELRDSGQLLQLTEHEGLAEVFDRAIAQRPLRLFHRRARGLAGGDRHLRGRAVGFFRDRGHARKRHGRSGDGYYGT